MAKLNQEQRQSIYEEFKSTVKFMYRSNNALINKVEEISWEDYEDNFLMNHAKAGAYDGPLEDIMYDSDLLEEYIVDKLTDQEIKKQEEQDGTI